MGCADGNESKSVIVLGRLARGRLASMWSSEDRRDARPLRIIAGRGLWLGIVGCGRPRSLGGASGRLPVPIARERLRGRPTTAPASSGPRSEADGRASAHLRRSTGHRRQPFPAEGRPSARERSRRTSGWPLTDPHRRSGANDKRPGGRDLRRRPTVHQDHRRPGAYAMKAHVPTPRRAAPDGTRRFRMDSARVAEAV